MLPAKYCNAGTLDTSATLAAELARGTATKKTDKPTPVLPYGLSFNDLAEAFKRGFLSQRVTRKQIKKDLKDFGVDLGAYMELLDFLQSNSDSTVILAVKGSFKTDELGRLVYMNKYFFTDLNPRLFPSAFYLKSLVYGN